MSAGAYFLQVVEELEERHIGTICELLIYGLVGNTSKELQGIIIKPIQLGGKKRTIYFHDIDRMIQILESMSIK
jgi:hypothetical protein